MTSSTTMQRLMHLVDPTFFPGRAATIFLRCPPKERETGSIRRGEGEGEGLIKPLNNEMAIGTIGILHPDVLQNFDIGYPCSALEFTLEPFKKEGHAVWKEG
jgi:phenylalanyl-tRNA synthetase beta chain